MYKHFPKKNKAADLHVNHEMDTVGNENFTVHKTNIYVEGPA